MRVHVRWLLVVIGLLIPGLTPLRAQVPVIDALNLVETVQIAYNTYQTYRSLLQEYEVVVRMAQRLGNMQRFRTPDVAFATHELTRYPEGGPLLAAFNHGDPTATGYRRVVRALAALDRTGAIRAELRPHLERAYATIELADSTASLAGHQVGHVRSFSRGLAEVIAALETDTVGGSDDEHQQTAILDRLAATEIVARRQDTAANQLLSHLVEQALVQNKRQRDAEAVVMNMHINSEQHAIAYGRSFFTPASDAQIRAWRQP